MSDNIELKPMGRSAPTPPPRHPETSSLHAAFQAAEEKARAAVHLQEGNLDAVSIWGLAVSAWFAALAIPLLLFPRIILFFAQSPSAPHISTLAREEHYDTFTPLESYLVLIVAIGLLSLSLTSLLTLAPSYQPPSTNPSRKPLLGILVGLTTLATLLCFNTAAIGGLGSFLGVGNLAVAVWGWWVVMFGEMKRVDKKSKVPERFKKL